MIEFVNDFTVGATYIVIFAEISPIITKTRLLMNYRSHQGLRGEEKSRQIEAIRCLRRKLQRALKVRLTNEEVADYWVKSSFFQYFSDHLYKAGKFA